MRFSASYYYNNKNIFVFTVRDWKTGNIYEMQFPYFDGKNKQEFWQDLMRTEYPNAIRWLKES